ncbi:MAG: saccharopine dehydrogenase NADP-binding domain-containing protein [Planctomycetia bacterium]|nr:saccharopine dehydrogenase NADP-binding domain-containing protein [Planctomycetia bacterium]
MSDWLLYGANGYTAKLIAREAKACGMRPILAGRNRRTIDALARELDCESRIFNLDDAAALTTNLRGIQVVLNCAGPFVRTSPPLIAACIKAKVSYLDITGEIDAIEHAATCRDAARAAGVSIIPSVGFDVVPTDCLAAMLKAEMPDATHLALAFTGSGTLSPGTAKTALESLPHGGRARIAGRIEAVPAGWKTRTIPFPGGPKRATTIAWGDVASAYYSTGIPNIETYTVLGKHAGKRMRLLAPLLKFPPLLALGRWFIDRMIKGPSADELANGRSEIWGEVTNEAGRTHTATLTTPNGYRLTVLTSLAAVERILKGNIATGFQTPSRAFGKDFVLAISGVRLGE